jgi:hypothetical protein
MWVMKAPKNFGKIAILKFENMRADFLRRCLNLLRQVDEKMARNGRKVSNS